MIDLSNQHCIAFVGKVPSLTTTLLQTFDQVPDLVVTSYAPYRRFAIQLDDDGLDSLGIYAGDYLVFREQRWPTNELQICLITLGDEATVRLIQHILDSEVTLKVTAEKILDLELAPTDFCVIGVLDGIVKESLAEFIIRHEREFDWGC